MKRFDCLKPTSPLWGQYLLEASAGTGKTFAIEHLFVRLLIDPKQYIPLEKIVVMTFTKAAVKDVKNRIRKNIETAIDLLEKKEKETSFHYLLDVMHDPDKNWKARRCLYEALYMFDRCQIFTIHSFCYQMLAEFRFEANFSADNTISNTTHLLEEEASNYFFHNIKSKDINAFELLQVFRRYPQTDILLQKIHKNYEKKAASSIGCLANLYETFQQKIKFIASFIKDKNLSPDQDFSSIFTSFKKRKGFSYEKAQRFIKRLLFFCEVQKISLSQFQDILPDFILFLEYFADVNKKKKIHLSIEERPLYQFIKKIEEIFTETIYQLQDVSQILQKLANNIFLQMQIRKEKESILSYDDILATMLSALDNFSFLSSVREKYKAVIIDEFQDTDVVQWQIFERLFLHNETVSSLFLVGDPKQAIYRFRKADIYTYLQAAEKLGPCAKFYLDTNFRSDKHLVHSLNKLFLENTSPWLTLPLRGESLQYLSVEAGLDNIATIQDDKKALHFFVAEDNDFTFRGPSSIVEESFYEETAKEILSLHKKYNISFNDIAILVKDRYQLAKVKACLEKNNISYRSHNNCFSADSKAIAFLQKIMLSSLDTSYIKVALATPYFAFQEEDLQKFSDKDWERILLQFHTLHLLFTTGKISQWVSYFLHMKIKGKSVLENIAINIDKSLYQETMYLLETLLLHKHLLSFTKQGVASFFDDVLKKAQEEENILALSQEHAVNILTIHMSKGLEFAVVFVLGSFIRTPLEEDLDERENKELEAEKFRQFYVALTRAKIRVYVALAIDLERKRQETQTQSLNELFFTYKIQDLQLLDFSFSKETLFTFLRKYEKEQLLSWEIIQNKEKTNIVSFSSPSYSLLPPEAISLTYAKRRILSFSSFSFYEQKQETLEKNEDYPLSHEKIPPGAVTGTIIHKIFERILQEGSVKNKKRIQEIVQEEIMFTNLQGKEDILYFMVEKALTSTLSPYDFSLQEISSSQLQIEMEFLFLLPQNNFMKGFIDLVFFHEGKYFILDWKTNWLGDSADCYSQKNLQKQMQKHHYFLQAAIYSACLHKYLKAHKRDFSQNQFGGVFYFFLRGISSSSSGLYHFIPDLSLLDNIESKEDILCRD